MANVTEVFRTRDERGPQRQMQHPKVTSRLHPKRNDSQTDLRQRPHARPLLLMAKRGGSQMPGFATGVGSKADIGARR